MLPTAAWSSSKSTAFWQASAWSDGTRRLRQGDLVAVPSDPAPRRRLVRTSDPWRSVHEGVVVPVLTGGSAVLVVGDNPVRLERVVESERVDLTAGSDVDAAG